ncbi:MAG: hypothetical protein ACI9KE_006692 [Polyangiales bacterium]|jgi:hypothetical protein
MPELTTPALPAHLLDEDGILYSRELVVRDEPMPDRFSASPLVEGAEGLSWHSLVTGLETDRASMRERLEAALPTADARQRARFSTALSACYSGSFGFRRDGTGRADFDAWVATLPIKPDRARVEIDAPDSAFIPAPGCVLVPFTPETGHVPVGHGLLLYQLADVEPKLASAEFADAALFDADAVDDDSPSPHPYTLQAWSHSHAFEAAAFAVRDIYDTKSAIGFLNAVLRHLGSDARFRLLGTGASVYGPLDSVRDLVATP